MRCSASSGGFGTGYERLPDPRGPDSRTLLFSVNTGFPITTSRGMAPQLSRELTNQLSVPTTHLDGAAHLTALDIMRRTLASKKTGLVSCPGMK